MQLLSVFTFHLAGLQLHREREGCCCLLVGGNVIKTKTQQLTGNVKSGEKESFRKPLCSPVKKLHPYRN